MGRTWTIRTIGAAAAALAWTCAGDDDERDESAYGACLAYTAAVCECGIAQCGADGAGSCCGDEAADEQCSGLQRDATGKSPVEPADEEWAAYWTCRAEALAEKCIDEDGACSREYEEVEEAYDTGS